MRAKRLFLIALISMAGATAGLVAGRAVIGAGDDRRSEIHAMLHRELKPDPARRAHYARLERAFEIEHVRLEYALRASNAWLAAAIQNDQRDTPCVRAAVDATHHAMGELQKAMLAHMLAMRAVLAPADAERLEQRLVSALAADHL